MARTKKINESMGDLADAISEYLGEQSKIRAKYAALAEDEIEKRRARVLEMMFVTHGGSGPSEIANSTGISRSTVIRWRDEWKAAKDERERTAALTEEANRVHAEIDFGEGLYSEPVKPVAHDFGKEMEYGAENYDGNLTAYIAIGTEQVWLLTGEDFGEGGSPWEAEDNKISRPDWLTEDLMREVIETTGAKLMLAPWND